MTEWRSMSKAEFDAWHLEYRRANGYPKRGRNAATGAVRPVGVGMTTAYIEPVEVVKGLDVRVPAWGELAERGRRAAEPRRRDNGTVDATATAAADLELEAEPVDPLP